MDFKDKTVLVLAPHVDDGEFGCGGTMAKLTREGIRVLYWAFSLADKSLPIYFTTDDIQREMNKSLVDNIGLRPDDIVATKWPVRDFPLHRQSILEAMVEFGRRVEFDVVLTPSINDTHQDHKVIFEESFRAYGKSKNILCYEAPVNNINFSTNVFVKLSLSDMRKKVDAISEYLSQAHRFQTNKEAIWAQAKFRGLQGGGMEYAEVFELVRWRVQ